MPAGAVQATFMHFIAHNGFLQTDDYELEQLDSPLGFKRPLVSLTFDDSTPNLYNYVIPELDKLGYKSTQYVVTGATGARDDAGVLYQWSAEQIKDVHERGHEIGSHTEYHPNLALPGPTTVCKGRTPRRFRSSRPCRGRCVPPGRTQKTKNGSWLDPFGGTNLWLRPSTIGSPNQDLADTTLAQELGDSKRKLEGHIGYGVPTIAYPFGSYDSTVVAEEKALGLQGRPRRSTRATTRRSVSTGSRSRSRTSSRPSARRTGVVTKADRVLVRTRLCVAAGSDDERRHDHQAVQGVGGEGQGEQLLARARLPPGGRLGVNPYGTSTKRFAEQMKAIKDAGIEVKTMRDALNEVMPQTGQDWAKVPSPTDLPVDPGPIPGPIPGPNPNPPSDHVVVPPPTVIRRRSTRPRSTRRRRPRPRTRSVR